MLGLTQLELAKRFDVDRSTVAAWEINRREPDFSTLVSLAELYGVVTDYLLCRTNDPTGGPVPEKKQTPADTAGENIGDGATLTPMRELTDLLFNPDKVPTVNDLFASSLGAFIGRKQKIVLRYRLPQS